MKSMSISRRAGKKSNTHNLENTTDLLKKLENTPILPHFTLASMDISNLYTNIPVKETREIIANNLNNNNINPQAQQEILNCYDTTTNQNYFSNNGKILIQQEVLAIGAPTSGTMAEFFLQHLEETHLTHLSKKHSIAAYFRYVDDTRVVPKVMSNFFFCMRTGNSRRRRVRW